MQSDLGPVIGSLEPMKPVRRVSPRPEPHCALQRAASWVIGAVVGFGLLVVVVLIALALHIAAATLTRAHGPAEWIQRGGYKNALGELCCGERDCFELPDSDVKITPSGYFIKSVGETVPFHEATPSPTGTYWRCYWGGKRKCFFAPPGSA